MPSKWGSGDNHSFVFWGVYVGQMFVECLLFVEKMNSSQTTAPGGSCSGRGHLTGNQRARKPLGKWAVGEELAPVAAGPELLFWLQPCRTLQKATRQQVAWEELALKGGK